jgi:molybdopterin converting factor small subunit
MTDEIRPIEIRGFMKLDSILRKKYGSMPFYYETSNPMTGFELAEKIGVDPDDVEVIFVNGFVQGLDYIIHPGDRMAFLPPGCPGPYRIALGFYGKNQDNPNNFKIKEKKDV